MKKGRDSSQHLDLDVHALRDGDTHDEAERALVQTEVDQALVDTHLVAFPRRLLSEKTARAIVVLYVCRA